MTRPKSFLKGGHGAGKGRPHIEPPPADELSAPVPAALATVPLTFRPNGTIADSATAAELGRRGGAATARKLRLVDSLGLTALADDSAFAPYRTAADAFVAQHLADLASQAGGKVGSAPSTMVASAALQLAGSRFAFDRFAQTGDASWMKLGSSLANDSRQNLLAAYEIAVREAQARTDDAPPAGWVYAEDES